MQEKLDIIRVSKICAIVFDTDKARYVVHLDGGHSVVVDDGHAEHFYRMVCAANESDNSFFNRRG